MFLCIAFSNEWIGGSKISRRRSELEIRGAKNLSSRIFLAGKIATTVVGRDNDNALSLAILRVSHYYRSPSGYEKQAEPRYLPLGAYL